MIVETAQVAKEERCPPVKPEHRKGALDGIDATGVHVIDLHTNRSGAPAEHPAEALRPWREPLTVPARAGDRPVQRGPTVDAQTRGRIAARVVDASGDECHGVRLVIDQMGGIRD